MTAESAKSDVDVLPEFMFRLGQAYLACGEQTAQVELLLRRIAAVNGARRSRVVAFPTALFISLYEGPAERVTLAEGPTQTLRLDQIAEVYSLGAAAQRGDVSPREGLQQLGEALRKLPRFGVVASVVGHVILSVGVALVLSSTLINVGAAAILGAVVGVLKAVNRNRAVLAAPLPVVAATLVSGLVFLAVKQGLPIEPLYAVTPPLVTFLPGGMLTLGMVELAYGDMVSGSSRLMTGFVQLILLAFGLAAGALLIGYTPDYLVDGADELQVAPWTRWAQWTGVALFGIGAYLHFSAPRRSLLWMLLVLSLAFAVQQLTAGLIGNTGSGFFGMLVATPLSYLIQLRFKGPPAMVTFLPSFWLLVPGALGLSSVKHMMSDRAAGFDGLVTAVFVLASIALGTLMGAALYKWLTETFGVWRLQIGRAGSYLRRRKKQ
jgi:uncharacterized membrane protein YjjP (DUF1212 family)